MGQGTERLERDLESERRDLGRNLKELERRANTLTDWKWYYRNHPFAVLGTAFGGAALLGLLTRSRAGDAPSDWEAGSLDFASGGYDSPGYETPREAPRRSMRSHLAPHFATSAGRFAEQAGITWDHVVEALLAVAAAKTIDFVGQHIPGFNEEYTRRHGGNAAL